MEGQDSLGPSPFSAVLLKVINSACCHRQTPKCQRPGSGNKLFSFSQLSDARASSQCGKAAQADEGFNFEQELQHGPGH